MRVSVEAERWGVSPVVSAPPGCGEVVKVTEAVVVLVAGWSVTMNGGSATSPAVSPDGAHLKFCDGNTSMSVISPETADANSPFLTTLGSTALLDEGYHRK